jgi:putative ubiquitin-RnfH superfamily antitoxin RatB of RatAB toxin-antitoxin module
METAENITIEVVAALPDLQALVTLEVPSSTTVVEAIAMAKIGDRLPGLDYSDCPLAIWGAVVAPDRVLRDGDRVEILRPLRMDPRDARRQLASEGQVMGTAKSKDA